MTPEATPREALYIETGLLDIETIIEIKRLNMMARLNREKSQTMALMLNNPECKWMKRTKQIMEKYNITDEELMGSKESAREAIEIGAYIQFYQRMNKDRDEKSKLKHFLEGKGHWTAETPANYMQKLTRKQASTIFKLRTRMTKVKGNYKNGYPDMMCRECNRLRKHRNMY